MHTPPGTVSYIVRFPDCISTKSVFRLAYDILERFLPGLDWRPPTMISTCLTYV